VARRPRAAASASATWRDGVHLTGTSIWCDARRGKGVWFVSSLERVDRVQRMALAKGIGQLIATDATIAMLARAGLGDLSAPYRQRFTLGTLRLELVPSGRGLGAAALLADDAGKRVLYAASVRTRSGGLGEAGEVRACDALVVGAPYGEPHHAFPPLDEVAAQLHAWVTAQHALDRKPVLFVDTVLDALEIAARLKTDAIAPILRPAAARETAIIASRVGLVPRYVAPANTPRVYGCVDGERASAIESAGQRPVTALVSGRAVDGPDGCDAAFAWAGAAGHAELLRWIESTGAREVFATGPCAPAIVAALGARARVLGPPEQMPLFGAGA